MALQIPKPKQLQALGLIAFKAAQKLAIPAIASSRTTGKRKATKRGRKPTPAASL
jgi:hypothetical protein